MNNPEKKVSAGRELWNRMTKSTTLLMFFVLVAMIVIASISSPYFLTRQNLQAVLRDVSFVGMVAVAQSMLLLVGQLDLSVGKIASFCGIMGGLMMTKNGVNPVLAIIISLLLGLVLGTINGLIIAKLHLNAMVATMGMQGVYGGINLVITKGVTITGIPESVCRFGTGTAAGIPIPFIAALIVTVILAFFVMKTMTGRYIYAMGNSYEASRILGIPVNRINILLYGIVGIVSALAGLLYIARVGTAQAAIGESWPMNSIAAAVIGGVALTGGEGNPIGALLGSCIITIITNVIVLLGVNMYWQTAVSGIVVIIAISLSSVMTIVRGRRRIRSEAAKKMEG